MSLRFSFVCLIFSVCRCLEEQTEGALGAALGRRVLNTISGSHRKVGASWPQSMELSTVIGYTSRDKDCPIRYNLTLTKGSHRSAS